MVSILITRPDVDAWHSQKVYQQAFPSANIKVEPLMVVSKKAHNIPKKKYHAIIFTSKNAVRFAALDHVSYEAVFCVGDMTAEEAQKKGYHNIYSSQGNKRDLEVFIENFYSDLNNISLLRFKKKQMTEDELVVNLEKKGALVDTVVSYQVNPVLAFSQELVDAIRTQKIKVVLFYSPLVAKIFNDFIFKYNLQDFCRKMYVLGISKEAVDAVSQEVYEGCMYAVCPTEQSMIMCLEKIRNKIGI